jgi:hypothetical protein
MWHPLNVPEDIWDDDGPLEDKADAVMFTVRVLLKLAPYSKKWVSLLEAAKTLGDLLGQQGPGEPPGETRASEGKGGEPSLWSAEITTEGHEPVSVRGAIDDVAWIIARLYASGTSFKIRTLGLQEKEDMEKDADKARADAANKARIAKVGVDLMNAYNRGKTDPSDMATLGHDTMTGYEFYIEEDGLVIKIDLTRDRD